MAPKLPLPRGWKRRVRSSVLHILALSHYTCRGPAIFELPKLPDSTLNMSFSGVQNRWTSTPARKKDWLPKWDAQRVFLASSGEDNPARDQGVQYRWTSTPT